MGILDRLRRRPTWRYYQPNYSVQVASYDTAALYRTQPNLRAVVSYLADNAAQVPLKVHDRVSDTDRPRVMDSPAALLLARPNADTTPFELKRAVYSDLYLYGRCLCLVIPDKDAPSGWQMRQIPATWVESFGGSWAFAPESVTISHNGLAVEVPRERFILFHGYDPADPMRASAPVEALKDILHEQVESNAFRRQMWQRGGRFNAYISRPKDVEQWDDDSFERFKATWDESWAGDHASQGGKMPILEDGMEIRQVQFNSRDAQWAEAKKLGREDTAGVYHINPALIWPGSGQTYASAKDNARALYNEALAPQLMEVTDRLNMQLLPMVGEDESHYIAYDITIKTEGTWEEKISALQSATGAPFLTRNEARARLDLPAIDEAGDLIVPLNVALGGAGFVDGYNFAQPLFVPPMAPEPVKAVKAPEKRFKAAPEDEDSDEVTDALQKFFERQRKSVLPKIGAKKKDGESDWWDAERWNRELTELLHPIAQRQSAKVAKKSLAQLGISAANYSTERTEAYTEAMSRRRAEMINDKTYADLQAVDTWDGSEDADRATYSGVFDLADSRAEDLGISFATAIAGWAVLEGIHQCAEHSGALKTWVVTSSNPRPSHAQMDGETVPYDGEFSNGAKWPCDLVLDAADAANCQCQIEITIP